MAGTQEPRHCQKRQNLRGRQVWVPSSADSRQTFKETPLGPKRWETVVKGRLDADIEQSSVKGEEIDVNRRYGAEPVFNPRRALRVAGTRGL